ncbi:MAG: hypothetical protein RLZZ450_2741 [Pseudomonadota bacterium]|jgi:hypothetical protein
MIRRVQYAVCCVALIFLCASHAWAGTPADRYKVSTEAIGEVVTDARTGLVWQRTVNADSYTWDAAKAYCSALGSGWRLPGLKELLTLVDPTRTRPSIATVAFPNTPADWFWTASPDAGSSGYAWGVSFDGGDSSVSAVSGSGRVRCVR